ncbi:MAG: PIN domain-containing protein [Acidobacteria bacterium]|nr:PIN domain-containing protein [Acidobacteriota bacterium]
MILYAESSAVLAWLLGEEAPHRVRRALITADIVMASDLTLIECERVVIRAVALSEITEGDAADRRAHLRGAATQWHVLRISPEIVERARLPFPGEPIRTLDALHLASALAARSAVAGVELLSLDDRIRTAASRLGFRLQPA